MNQVPTAGQLCHMHQSGEPSLLFHNPEPPVNQPFTMQPPLESCVAPMYIGGGMLPIPPKLVKSIQEGHFVEMAELLPDTLKNPSLPDDTQSKDPSFTKLPTL